MQRRPERGLIFAMVFALACGGGAPRTETAAAVATGTRYRVGDYVVYRYAGRLIGPDPMLLMEEIVEQDGDRLVIEVTLSRGHDTVRAWRQTVISTGVVRLADPTQLCRPGSPGTPAEIDSEENREANHVEALCEIHGEACVPLANEGNADLLRMYEGLVVPRDGPATDVVETDETVDVAGTEMTCHVRRAQITRDGEPLNTKDVDCPDFLWTHAGSAVEMPDKRRVLLVTVESYGPPR